LTAEEREHAIRLDWAGSERIPSGYPLLIQRGEHLRKMGVRFVDLTSIFADEYRRVYSDFCCHVNQLGADIIARKIARVVSDRIGLRDNSVR
jgi:hypothetical protein